MKSLLTIGTALAAIVLSTGANAAVQCGPHERITTALNNHFQESRQALGLSGETAVIELFVSSNGTWTMTSTNARGLTCVIAAGEAWQADAKTVLGVNS